jgi:PAS domain S-box-containing protein
MSAAELDADALPDGVVTADANGTITVVNTAAERVLGQSAGELVGQDIRRALPLQDTEGARWWAETDPWGGLATRTGHRERLLLLPGEGGPREVYVTARYVRQERLGPVHLVVLGLRDAASRQRAQAEHGVLISTVAHELRSPLTSVKGFTATLLRRWDRFTDDQKRLMLETIEHDADRVTRLITELLDISRIDAGRLEVRRQPVDLVATAQRHVERMVASGHPENRFVVEAGRPLPEVWADPDRLDQVLANLLENAVRHGEGTVTMEIMATDLDGLGTSDGDAADATEAVAVVVTDEGEGIAEEDMQRVFTRFWHGSRRGGTGLGLYLVRGLVEAHGGTVQVGRGPTGGAQFRFTLPAGAPEHVA